MNVSTDLANMAGSTPKYVYSKNYVQFKHRNNGLTITEGHLERYSSNQCIHINDID